MQPTDILRNDSAGAWQSIARHPLCRAMAEATLPEAKMAAYLVQAHHLATGAARLLATSGVSAPALTPISERPEASYFRRAFAALGVPLEAHDAPPEPQTVRLLDLMETALRSGHPAQILAVLTAVHWSTLAWAGPLHPPQDQLPFWMSEWITLQGGPEAQRAVICLCQSLNAAWPDLSTAEQKTVAGLFSQTATAQYAFLDAAQDDWELTAPEA
ncbi:MAG: hypothetical protein ACK5IB_07465 [Qingshengfaniella sp.]